MQSQEQFLVFPLGGSNALYNIGDCEQDNLSFFFGLERGENWLILIAHVC